MECLFETCMKRKRTVVYGDLGRDPRAIFEHLVIFYSHLEDILIKSDYYDFCENEFIHVNAPYVPSCDLVIFIEPKRLPPSTFMPQCPVIVFTSFPLKPCVTFYNRPPKDDALLKLQHPSTSNVALAFKQVNFFNVRPLTEIEEFTERVFVLVDLTGCSCAHEARLRRLDDLDVMGRNLEFIEGWLAVEV